MEKRPKPFATVKPGPAKYQSHVQQSKQATHPVPTSHVQTFAEPTYPAAVVPPFTPVQYETSRGGCLGCVRRRNVTQYDSDLDRVIHTHAQRMMTLDSQITDEEEQIELYKRSIVELDESLKERRQERETLKSFIATIEEAKKSLPL